MNPGRYYLTDTLSYPAFIIRSLDTPGVFIVYFTDADAYRVAAERSDTPGAGVFVEGPFDRGIDIIVETPSNWSMDNTKAELTAAAESMGISVPSSWSKATILAAINGV
tara:strand:- start:9265 stop:9591 length:327 start_codon:yes stop_codon:yes gene_type:complete